MRKELATKPKPKPKAKPKPKLRRKSVPGYLTVAAHPYATVYVDGKEMGVTPIVRLPLPPPLAARQGYATMMVFESTEQDDGNR